MAPPVSKTIRLHALTSILHNYRATRDTTSVSRCRSIEYAIAASVYLTAIVLFIAFGATRTNCAAFMFLAVTFYIPLSAYLVALAIKKTRSFAAYIKFALIVPLAVYPFAVAALLAIYVSRRQAYNDYSSDNIPNADTEARVNSSIGSCDPAYVGCVIGLCTVGFAYGVLTIGGQLLRVWRQRGWTKRLKEEALRARLTARLKRQQRRQRRRPQEAEAEDQSNENTQLTTAVIR